MGRRHPVRRLGSAFVLLLFLGLISTGCLTSFSPPGQLTCSGDEDCPDDMGCATEVGLCFHRCVEAIDCPTLAYRCEGGLCLPVVGAECQAHEECLSPGLCEVTEDASCLEGRCAYSPLPCDRPPEKECLEGDDTIRVYSSMGLCALAGPLAGECAYGFTDVPCPSCTESCLENDPCEGFLCPDEAGGCLVHGVCLPLRPPVCQYEHAPKNTPCDRDGSPTGSLDGHCSEGSCGAEILTPCLDNDACTPLTCIAGFCRPEAVFLGTCDVGDDDDCGPHLECPNGLCLKSHGQACAENSHCVGTCIIEECRSPSGVSGPCDADSGGDDDDCQVGLYCNGGTCEAAMACASDSVCPGDQVCIGGYCRARAQTGGTCDPGQDSDCVANHACVGGVCLRTNGQACTSNTQCVNVCISLLCEDPSGTRGPCDTADGAADCLSGHTCSSSLCLLLDGQSGCTADNQCLNTCITGTCGPRVGTGETCDSAGDCLSGHTCSGGACLRNDGQSCTSNTQCLGVCIGSLCGSPSGTGGACDTADGNADCQANHTCSGGTCLRNNGQTCTANSQCLGVCIGGTCASPSGAGGACDIADGNADCQTGYTCSGGTCLGNNGQTCTSNTQCLNVCIGGTCASLSGTGGACDTADGNADCQANHTCSGGTCLRNNGQTCTANTQCLNVCIGGSCVSPSGTGGACDTADGNADCQANHTCSGGTCLRNNGQTCTTNSQCLNTCIAGTCASRSSLGGACDDHDDCQGLYVCFSLKCNENGVAQIRVQGSSVSGGGGPIEGWYLVEPLGASIKAVSAGTSVALFHTIDWTASLTDVIATGDTFAIASNEGSADITRTFTFYDVLGAQISQLVIGPKDSGHIVRIFSSTRDNWVRFRYDGSQVTWQQMYKPIGRIRITGSDTPSGGGSGLSGYYRVSSTGANLGQLSSGHTSTLYVTTSWEVTLTTLIYDDTTFALVGSEGSGALSRTFTFMDTAGTTINSFTITASGGSGDIIRTNTFPSSDIYAHFTYSGGAATWESRTSP